MNEGFWNRLPTETLTDLLELARETGATDEARRIWDALCEQHGHRCDTCRMCRGWKRGAAVNGYRET